MDEFVAFDSIVTLFYRRKNAILYEKEKIDYLFFERRLDETIHDRNSQNINLIETVFGNNRKKLWKHF
jgi:hypothetical protein